MNWFIDMFLIWLFGAIPIILSLVFGTYYLRNDRFPWEKKIDRVESEEFDTAKRLTT